jgi:hypothetical protein
MALANLVLADGQSTPANHTFTYDAEVPEARWSEKTGIAIGSPVVAIGSSRPSRSRSSFKTALKVEIPVLEVISGDAGGYTPAPKVAYTMRFTGTFESPDRSTTQNRKDLHAFVADLISEAMVKAMIVDYSPPA